MSEKKEHDGGRFLPLMTSKPIGNFMIVWSLVFAFVRTREEEREREREEREGVVARSLTKL